MEPPRTLNPHDTPHADSATDYGNLFIYLFIYYQRAFNPLELTNPPAPGGSRVNTHVAPKWTHPLIPEKEEPGVDTKTEKEEWNFGPIHSAKPLGFNLPHKLKTKIGFVLQNSYGQENGMEELE